MNNVRLELITMVITLFVFVFSANQIQAEGKLGQEQEEEERGSKSSLRFSRVLLKRGEGSMRIIASHQTKKETTLLGNDISRDFSLRMAVRLSPAHNVVIHVSAPLTHSKKKWESGDISESESESGLGSISTGIKFLVAQEENGWPEIVGSLDIGIPTSMGIDHYSVGGDLMFVKTVHPASLFANIGYTHYFAKNIDGREIQPGGSINYGAGFDFALNYNNLSLSSQISGSYKLKTTVDETDVPLSNLEPMMLTNTLSYSIDPLTSLDPSISIGLNDDAPDTGLSISFSRRF